MSQLLQDLQAEHTTLDPEPPHNSGLFDTLIVLSRRRRLILISTLGAAVLTAVVVFLLPSRYTATTLVLPPGQNSSMSSALMGQLGGSSALASVAGAGLGIKNTGDMYVSLFRSRTVEDSMIQRFNLMQRYRQTVLSSARSEFEQNSTVIFGTKDGLIRITVTDKDPRMAADLANGYVDEFRKLSSGLAISEASQRRLFFQQQLLEAKTNLSKAEEALKQTQESTGIIQLDSQSRSLIESSSTLRAQIVAKEVQLSAMSSYATANNPERVVVEEQLSALKAQLAKISGNGQSGDSDPIVPKGKAPGAALEYLRKVRDVKYYDTISELIAKQFEVAKLDEAREGAIVQVADVAVPPDKKSSPHRLLSVLLVTLLAFIASALWSFGSARWEQVLRDPQKRRKIQELRALHRKKAQPVL